MFSWTNFKFKPFTIDLPPFKYTLCAAPESDEGAVNTADTTNDNTEKVTANIRSLNINAVESDENEDGSITPSPPPTVPEHEWLTDDSSSLEDGASEECVELTPSSSSKIDIWKWTQEQRNLTLKMNKETGTKPKKSAPIRSRMENCFGEGVELEHTQRRSTALEQKDIYKWSFPEFD